MQTTPKMLELDGYQITSPIYESANSIVYRGIRSRDSQAAILKILKQDYPTPAELVRYKQEYEIVRSLDIEGVAKAYSLQEYERSLVIIFEDFGGNSLKMLLDELRETQKVMFLREFLPLAIQVAEILGRVHAANIIHKDINPANIILNPETGRVKIIDFGISTQLTRENPHSKKPQCLRRDIGIYFSRTNWENESGDRLPHGFLFPGSHILRTAHGKVAF